MYGYIHTVIYIYVFIHTYKMYMLSIGKPVDCVKVHSLGSLSFTHTHLPPRYFLVEPPTCGYGKKKISSSPSFIEVGFSQLHIGPRVIKGAHLTIQSFPI